MDIQLELGTEDCLTLSLLWSIWQREDIKCHTSQGQDLKRSGILWIPIESGHWKFDGWLKPSHHYNKNPREPEAAWWIFRDNRVLPNLDFRLWPYSKTIVSFFERTRLKPLEWTRDCWGSIWHLEGKTSFGPHVRIAQFTETIQIIHS